MAGVALTDGQAAVLARIAAGVVADEVTIPERLSARALATRRLVRISGRGPTWSAKLTPAGEHYVRTGEYPEGHWGTPKASKAGPEPAARQAPAKPTPAPAPSAAKEWSVESPRGKRERGYRPMGDSLFEESAPDPWDERILISVKEAAWLLSLTENAIRAAIRNGDVDRVFIGEGKTHYRVVYGSLLAWVNDMPRESAAHQWWGSGRGYTPPPPRPEPRRRRYAR